MTGVDGIMTTDHLLLLHPQCTMMPLEIKFHLREKVEVYMPKIGLLKWLEFLYLLICALSNLDNLHKSTLEVILKPHLIAWSETNK